MLQLHEQRCLHHTLREAVARCPSCAQHFCRECVTEHDGALLCAGCLRKLTTAVEERKRRWAGASRAVAACAGVLLAWMCFYVAGQWLVSMPSEFHEGTLWKRDLLSK
ncbi:MAG: rhomboid family protein [Verrucomicrobia bacterium]|nr:rhomboid family protein [Verrucomicrobiota bacterium]